MRGVRGPGGHRPGKTRQDSGGSRAKLLAYFAGAPVPLTRLPSGPGGAPRAPSYTELARVSLGVLGVSGYPGHDLMNLSPHPGGRKAKKAQAGPP